MSRGGRGGRGRGGRKTGPDLSWQDDDDNAEVLAPSRRIPGPMFPARQIVTPKPLTTTEKAQVRSLLSVRDQIRNGPLYTVLEPSSLLDDKGRANLRAGFDPFNHQEQYTKKYHLKRRTLPDLSERGGYSLNLFPVELWSVLDPKRKQTEYWDGLSEEVKSKIKGVGGTKRKRVKLKFDEDDVAADQKQSSSESENDPTLDANRRRKKAAVKTRKNDPTVGKRKEKKGLDAEDDYPEVDQQDDDAEGGGGAAAAGDEELQDSEFGSDEDDDREDDYNAENYFDDGAEDDMAEADDDGGGGGGDYY